MKLSLWDTRLGDVKADLIVVNNYDAVTDPLVTDDTSKGYVVGSTWVNRTGQRIWEAVSVAVGAAVWLPASGGATATLGTQATPAAKTVSVTLTAAEILTGIITGNQGGGAAANYQMPTASAFEAALIAQFGPLPALPAQAKYDFNVINISTNAAEVVTITTNTGWTLFGDMNFAANAAGDQSGGQLRAVRTAANTYSLYRIA
jgi:hypothetical protein